MAVKIVTKETVGELLYETSYEFSSYDEFMAFEKFKDDQMKMQVSGSLNDLLFGSIGDTEDFGPEPSFEAVVTKKKVVH
jgi:hypothetical protein